MGGLQTTAVSREQKNNKSRNNATKCNTTTHCFAYFRKRKLLWQDVNLEKSWRNPYSFLQLAGSCGADPAAVRTIQTLSPDLNHHTVIHNKPCSPAASPLPTPTTTTTPPPSQAPQRDANLSMFKLWSLDLEHTRLLAGHRLSTCSDSEFSCVSGAERRWGVLTLTFGLRSAQKLWEMQWDV